MVRPPAQFEVPLSGLSTRPHWLRARSWRIAVPKTCVVSALVPPRPLSSQMHPSYEIRSDHPRVGGEHWTTAHNDWLSYGSSPRRRGTHHAIGLEVGPGRIIPAQAGNTGSGYARSSPAPDHPRAGGEHRHRFHGVDQDHGSSPRGRGTPMGHGSRPAVQRIIPAWAGNTRASSTRG